MKVLRDKIRSYMGRLSFVEDPIEAAKEVISSIQKIVGIRNVFGENKRSKITYKYLEILIEGDENNLLLRSI